MLMEGRPAVEEKKATRTIVRLTIRHSMRVVWFQIYDIRLLETRINKSHSPIRSSGLCASENITRPCFIERPNSNLTIPSGLFFFHRGLPFSKRGHSHNLHEYTRVRTYASTLMRNAAIQIIQVKAFTSPKPFCVRAHFQHRSRFSSRILPALLVFA